MVQLSWQAGQIKAAIIHKKNAMQAAGMTEHPSRADGHFVCRIRTIR